jgi:hypothetical protein
MLKAGDAVVHQPSCEIEHKILFLPSDFSCDEWQEVEAMALGIEEAKLREGEAFDAFCATQNAVKTILALLDRMQKHVHGQAKNMRSSSYVREAQGWEDHHMSTYATCHTAMIALGILNENDPQSSFPPLSLEDTFMKLTQHGRGLGDSHRTDGMLWHKHGDPTETDDSPVAGAWSDVHSDETGVDASNSGYCTYILFSTIHHLLSENGTQMSRQKKSNASCFLWIGLADNV